MNNKITLVYEKNKNTLFGDFIGKRKEIGQIQRPKQILDNIEVHVRRSSCKDAQGAYHWQALV
jgi:hypothetical protein